MSKVFKRNSDESIIIKILVIIYIIASLIYIYDLRSEPPEIIYKTKVEYKDDYCLCIKCTKRFNYNEVNYLITKIEENELQETKK